MGKFSKITYLGWVYILFFIMGKWEFLTKRTDFYILFLKISKTIDFWGHIYRYICPPDTVIVSQRERVERHVAPLWHDGWCYFWTDISWYIESTITVLGIDGSFFAWTGARWTHDLAPYKIILLITHESVLGDIRFFYMF